MRETKVYLVLERLSNRERGRCLKFVQSPYFNKNKVLIELFGILHKDLNSSRSKPLSKEKTWNSIQTNIPYDDLRFRKYLSDLLRLVEKFLAQEQFEKDDYQRSIYELEAVLDKKIERLYAGMRKFVKKMPDNTSFRNSKYYYYLLEASKLLHDLETEIEQKKKISTNFSKLSDALDIFYISEKLRLDYDATIWKRIDGSLNATISFVDELHHFIKKKPHLEEPPVKVYYAINQLSKNPGKEQYYFEYKRQLNDNIDFFPPAEAIPIYSAGINHCIRRLNTGDAEYLKELFILYVGFVKATVEYTSELSQWTFNNVITVALRSGKYKWVRQFIEEYGLYIDEKHRENAVSYNTASYYFYLKDYDKVVRTLMSIEYKDVYYNLNSKTILLMTYYETTDYEPLSFLFESFRAYLNRNDNIPKSKKILYKNLIRLTKRLVNLPPKSKTGLQKLKKEVMDNKNIASRSWLLEKITALE